MAGPLDSTQALLDFTIQDSALQDESEDEVFFGAVHSVEKNGRSKIRHDTTLNEMDFSPMKTSRRLDRSNHSLLSADNSIPEESEEEEENEEMGDSEEKRGESAGKAVSINNSVKERRRCLVSNSSDEARRSQTSSEGWETQSETSCMEASGSVDATEMEVPLNEKEVKGKVEQSEAVEEVGRPNEEEEYRKDIEYLVGREDEESDEETQDDDDTSQQEEVEQEEEARQPSRHHSPPQLRLTRPSREWSQSDFQGGESHPVQLEDSRPTSQMSQLPEETSTRSIYHTAPSSPRRSEAPEPCFDTTADEMILFDMYGEDYDEMVDAMSMEEKRVLQEEVEKRKAGESGDALQARMRRLDSMGSIASTISPFSLASPSPCTAQQGQSFTHLGGEMTEEELVGEQVEDSLQRRLLEEQERELERKVLAKQEAERIRWLQEDAQRQKAKEKEEDMEVMEKAATPRGRRALRDGEATYTQHTQASLFRRVSPSPKKTPMGKPAWVPASPIPGRELALSPVKPLGVSRPSRIPQPVAIAKPLPALRNVKAATQMVVNSPVADYVKNNPAPHLVRNVIAKEVVRPLDSTLMEVDLLSSTLATELVNQVESNKENAAVPPCPLPANTYTSAHLYQETKHAPIPVREYRYIPEAYGLQGSAEASVTKHLSRKKLEQEQMQTSEGFSKAITPIKTSLPSQTPCLDVSVLETKVVRKFATPLRSADSNN